MNKISNIKVISIDLFRTLVDIDLSVESVWKIFLKEKYTPDLGLKYWNRATEIVLKNLFAAAVDDSQFKNTRSIFEDTYSALFKEIDLDYDAKAAAGTLIEGHKPKRLFEDALPFLETAGKKYPICLSTDCDIEMLDGVSEIYSFDKVFISEELKAYKLNPRFFTHLIRQYNLKPHEILHIGDSQQDITTPKKLGLLTCWLNRHDSPWKETIQPDFEVKSLTDILDILE
jgi:HAD superfamily hydrolase (TIGR01549 family)